ncbi:MAG: protein-L-isoaspartate(D-aspartate) O-methyltransferase [Thermoanaerobaculia bacterium]|nr:protein-L-isoaspartate(D-aspartate) O-methyltransferase [Thermoanaerobaculia bacterium]
MNDDDFRYLRRRMVADLRRRGIADERVLDAMGSVPRHRFVRGQFLSKAYGNYTLPIGDGQTLTQPWVVARMSELLEVEPSHRVLEIGTGSGYQTAVLARLARWVFSLERVGSLARSAIRRFQELGLDNVKVGHFDGTVGWGEAAPFDRILVTAGAPKVPKPLLDQLTEGGILVLPEGGRTRQHLVKYRRGAKKLRRIEGEEVGFVPLIGRNSWQS